MDYKKVEKVREERMRKASKILNGYMGSFARGWCDGFDDLPPNVGKRNDIEAYEKGWLNGAAEKEKGK